MRADRPPHVKNMDEQSMLLIIGVEIFPSMRGIINYSLTLNLLHLTVSRSLHPYDALSSA
jgi:hypothetical protein